MSSWAQNPDFRVLNDSAEIELLNFKGEVFQMKKDVVYILFDGNSCEKCLNLNPLGDKEDFVFLTYWEGKIKNLGIQKKLSSKHQRSVFFTRSKVIFLKDDSFEFGKDIGPLYFKLW